MGYTTITSFGQEIEKYAWFPVRTASKKWIWLKKYYAIVNYLNTETVRYPTQPKRLTEKEYTMYLLTKKEYVPSASSVTAAPMPRQKPLRR